jgi:hypothetical protein
MGLTIQSRLHGLVGHDWQSRRCHGQHTHCPALSVGLTTNARAARTAGTVSPAAAKGPLRAAGSSRDAALKAATPAAMMALPPYLWEQAAAYVRLGSAGGTRQQGMPHVRSTWATCGRFQLHMICCPCGHTTWYSQGSMAQLRSSCSECRR